MNFKANQPHEHLSFYSNALRTDRWLLKDELLESLENITEAQLQSFVDDVYLPQVFIESLMMGNLTAQGCYLYTK